MNKKGTLFVVSGPSGAGKGTVLEYVFEVCKNLIYSVSDTTRAPREGENESHYNFISSAEFEQKISSGEYLEYAKFVDNYYGTPRKFVDEMLEQGISVILEIEVDGAAQVKAKMPESVLIFIAPPSIEELIKRLKGRGTEDERIIEKRVAKAEFEIAQSGFYDHIIINEYYKKSRIEIVDLIKSYQN